MTTCKRRVASTAVILMSCAPFACAAPVRLTAAGRGVQLMKADPPSGCTELGAVNGQAWHGVAAGEPSVGDQLAAAKNDMRNKAAALGANYVRLETIVETDLQGTAYRCPDVAPGSAQTP